MKALHIAQVTLQALFIGCVLSNSIQISSAVIVFQDDSFHQIPSPAVLIDSDNATGSGIDIDIIANQGTDNNGTLRYNASTNVWELSNDGGLFEVIATQNSVDLDIVYDNDTDKTLAIDNIAGLNFDLTGIGGFSIQDNGSSFITFQDDGLIQLSGPEDKEYFRFSDTTNLDSVGLFSGLGSPDTNLSAEAGSLFLDQEGIGYLNTSADSGNEWSAFDLQKANYITVAKQGGQFTSIATALTSITDNSAANPYVIRIYPGVYQENPLTMKSFVDLIGIGEVESVKIEALNPSANLITMATESTFANTILDGVSSGSCIFAAGITGAIVSNIEFEDCEYGIRANLAQVNSSNLRHRTGSMTSFAYAENGAFLRVLESSLGSGTITNGYVATGSGTTLILTNSGVVNATVTNGVYIDNGAIFRGGGLLLNNTTNALRIGPNGSGSTIQAGNIVAGGIQYDLLVETNTANIAISSGIVDRNKVLIPSGNNISIFINDQTNENKGTVNLGELATGSPENPSEGNFGEGDSYTAGMLVYTFNPTGSVYTDVSTEAQSVSGSTLNFPGTSTDNAIYLSSDRTDPNGNAALFQGYTFLTSSTALTQGAGSIIHEYWNGSSWVSTSIMCTHETLYHRYDAECFLRANNSEEVRFDNHILENWVANDPPGTGTNRYWIRIRIASTITTAPIFEQFKIHSSRTKIGLDGTLNFFADARHRRTFITSPEQILFGVGSSSPGNVSYTVGNGASSWTDERSRASFSGNGLQIREITGSIALPKGIDTSNGLIARIYWKKENNDTGNVQWHIDYLVRGARNVPVSDGSNITPAPRTTGDSITATGSSTIETNPIGNSILETEIILSEFIQEIDISQYYEGDTLFLRLYRDAGDPEDTYSSDAIMTGFELSGVFWTLGEKL